MKTQSKTIKLTSTENPVFDDTLFRNQMAQYSYLLIKRTASGTSYINDWKVAIYLDNQLSIVDTWPLFVFLRDNYSESNLYTKVEGIDKNGNKLVGLYGDGATDKIHFVWDNNIDTDIDSDGIIDNKLVFMYDYNDIYLHKISKTGNSTDLNDSDTLLRTSDIGYKTYYHRIKVSFHANKPETTTPYTYEVLCNVISTTNNISIYGKAEKGPDILSALSSNNVLYSPGRSVDDSNSQRIFIPVISPIKVTKDSDLTDVSYIEPTTNYQSYLEFTFHRSSSVATYNLESLKLFYGGYTSGVTANITSNNISINTLYKLELGWAIY